MDGAYGGTKSSSMRAHAVSAFRPLYCFSLFCCHSEFVGLL